MRVGIDVHPIHAPETAMRGIGRFTTGLVKALVTTCPADEFILYRRDTDNDVDLMTGMNLLDTFIHSNPNTSLKVYHENEKSKHQSLDEITDNRDHLDWLIITSPHQSCVTTHGSIPRVASILYDMIPLKFPDIYLNHPELEWYKDRFHKYIQSIKKYDKILAISRSTIDDAVSLAGLDVNKISLIHCGVDDRFKPRDLRWLYPNWLKEMTNGQPYVLHVGGMDPRKGGIELLDAWHMLPARIRTRFYLIYVYEADSHHTFMMNQRSNMQGLNVKFLMLGNVKDETLVHLYQNARLMCLPSKYEGFGLPFLEAMACGCPVIGGDNSSQPFVIGDGGLVVDQDSREDIARDIEMLINDTDLHERLSRRGLARAALPIFSWPHVAQTCMEQLATAMNPDITKGKNKTISPVTLTKSRPKLAFFGLVPPTLSGVTTLSLRLANALTKHYEVTYYHDPRITPDIDQDSYGFSDILPESKYDGCPRLVWQMGNSEHHEWMFRLMLRRGGVVTMHDARLDDLCNMMNMNGSMPWTGRVGNIEKPSYLVDEIVNAGCRTVVHSQAAYYLMRERSTCVPDAVIPPGMDLNIRDKEEINAMRSKMGWSRFATDARSVVYLGTGGFIHHAKMIDELMSAYVIARRTLIENFNKKLVLILIGKEVDNDRSRRTVRDLAIPDVMWTGEIEFGNFCNVMTCLDICVQLRREPTNGETSGAMMDAIRGSVPCIVSNVGAFAEFPDFVTKVDNDTRISINLSREIVSLAVDPVRHSGIASSGYAWTVEERSWANVASMYVPIIESLFREK